LGLSFGLLDFLLGFWLFVLVGFLLLDVGKKLLLWAFWCGKLLEGKELLKGKIAVGKRTVEGKMLKRG
jgi:hypothetical protein